MLIISLKVVKSIIIGIAMIISIRDNLRGRRLEFRSEYKKAILVR